VIFLALLDKKKKEPEATGAEEEYSGPLKEYRRGK